MKKVRNCISALLIGCCMPLLIWAGLGVALYQRKKEANLLKQALANMMCSINADCPPGFVCLDGHCIPARTR